MTGCCFPGARKLYSVEGGRRERETWLIRMSDFTFFAGSQQPIRPPSLSVLICAVLKLGRTRRSYGYIREFAQIQNGGRWGTTHQACLSSGLDRSRTTQAAGRTMGWQRSYFRRYVRGPCSFLPLVLTSTASLRALNLQDFASLSELAIRRLSPSSTVIRAFEIFLHHHRARASERLQRSLRVTAASPSPPFAIPNGLQAGVCGSRFARAGSPAAVVTGRWSSCALCPSPLHPPAASLALQASVLARSVVRFSFSGSGEGKGAGGKKLEGGGLAVDEVFWMRLPEVAAGAVCPTSPQ